MALDDLGPRSWARPEVLASGRLPMATTRRHDDRRPETYVTLDAAHRGVGTGACGPDTLPQYRVGPGTYRWGYTIRQAATDLL